MWAGSSTTAFARSAFTYGCSNSPSSNFSFRIRADGLVDPPLGHLAVRDRVDAFSKYRSPVGRRTCRRRQRDHRHVDAGVERQRDRVLHVVRHVPLGHERLDVVPVADRDALEAELAAQHVRQQTCDACTGLAVHRAAVDHHRCARPRRSRLANGGRWMSPQLAHRRSSRRCGRARCRAPSSRRSACAVAATESRAGGPGPARRARTPRRACRSGTGPRRTARRSGPSAGRARCRTRARSPSARRSPARRRRSRRPSLRRAGVEGRPQADLVRDVRRVGEVVVAVHPVGAVDDRDAEARALERHPLDVVRDTRAQPLPSFVYWGGGHAPPPERTDPMLSWSKTSSTIVGTEPASPRACPGRRAAPRS